jgi:GNAT superfamily N-acetyltransferase
MQKRLPAMRIRPHVLADSDQIAEILARGWAEANSGFLPAEVLAPRIDVGARQVELRDFLGSEFDAANEAMFVADAGDQLSGFAHAILGDKGGLGAVGHIGLLYVRAEYQGQGVGRRLLGAAAGWIAERASGPLAIAAFAENPFHAFYAHLGGEIAARVPVEVSGHRTGSVIYLWPDATALAAQLMR